MSNIVDGIKMKMGRSTVIIFKKYEEDTQAQIKALEIAGKISSIKNQSK